MQCKIYCQHQIIHKFYLSIASDRISVCHKNNRFHEQSDGFHEQSDRFHDQSDRFYEQSDRFYEQSDGFHEQSDRFHEQSDRFHEQSDRFYEQSDRFHKQNDRFHDQSDRFHDQSDRFDHYKLVIWKCDVYDGLHLRNIFAILIAAVFYPRNKKEQKYASLQAQRHN
ncbi:hypothetical protein [Nostoc sp.]|uniref:hypothetical protein n=1 Tax=Nostoc sp. TaxID=1180 RepID=UPI002FFC749F